MNLVQPKDMLILPKLGIDKMEFSPTREQKELQNLSIECYSSCFEKEYREWEKKEYGTNLHLYKFVVKKDRKYNSSPYYVPPPPSGIMFGTWSKKEEWFRQNFTFEDRVYGLDLFVDTIGFNRDYKARVKQIVDSTIKERKLKMQKVVE